MGAPAGGSDAGCGWPGQGRQGHAPPDTHTRIRTHTSTHTLTHKHTRARARLGTASRAPAAQQLLPPRGCKPLLDASTRTSRKGVGHGCAFDCGLITRPHCCAALVAFRCPASRASSEERQEATGWQEPHSGFNLVFESLPHLPRRHTCSCPTRLPAVHFLWPQGTSHACSGGSSSRLAESCFPEMPPILCLLQACQPAQQMSTCTKRAEVLPWLGRLV
ncbi:MAG: hypothetical protein J3K34DRAFT_443151 [Monoraphidium minutum]|nr:MAG: hypothetical protein J3K34DRAFT_443151 [Monoraphidium minutum]